MPEFEITFRLEKTFDVQAKTVSEAQEKGAEILAEYLALNESAITTEIHHVEA